MENGFEVVAHPGMEVGTLLHAEQLVTERMSAGREQHSVGHEGRWKLPGGRLGDADPEDDGVGIGSAEARDELTRGRQSREPPGHVHSPPSMRACSHRSRVGSDAGSTPRSRAESRRRSAEAAVHDSAHGLGPTAVRQSLAV